MLKSTITRRRPQRKCFRWSGLILSAFLFAFALPTSAQTNSQASAPKDETPSDQIQQRLERLASVAKQIETRSNELKELRLRAFAGGIGPEDTELRKQIATEQAKLDNLQSTFSQIATNGIQSLSDATATEKAYSWQDELVDVIRPVLGGLKEITEKPRRIEEIRTRIDNLTEQSQRADEALQSLKAYSTDGMGPELARNFAALQALWTERQNEAKNGIDVARVQLTALESKSLSYQDVVVRPIKDFVLGRGLTLSIAIGVAALLWSGLSFLSKPLIRRLSADLNKKQRRTRERAIAYLYRSLSIVAVAAAMLVVFYVRSDMLLLALSVLFLAGIAIALRSFVPRYLRELRLLVNAGAVREGERLIYQGLPMEVRSINASAVFRNPELEGIIRLPLTELLDLTSRPAGEEPWFPSSAGDTLLLPDGSLATVERQTLEIVRLKVAGSLIDKSATDFAAMNAQNLSREGFILPITFGIDYQHQAISLTEVPDALYEGVNQSLKESVVAPYITRVKVDFQAAAANSLDYLVIVSVTGEAAPSYYAMGRLIQQALVRVCNEKEWGIPFAQMTVHAGDGFAR